MATVQQPVPGSQPPTTVLALDDFLEEIRRVYGYDFTGYARASLSRRIEAAIARERLPDLASLAARVLADHDAMGRLLLDFSVNSTGMFRDPGFWRCLRQQALPYLATFPGLRVWSVGCSTGEEVWSLAILLHEAGLAARTIIYATDFNAAVLARAQSGIFDLGEMRTYTENYIAAGGREEFAGYYTAAHGGARFDPALMRNACFAQHNLASDGVFNEFNLILCRNVLIYFGPALQHRVHDLLHASLAPLCLLGLGDKESLRFDPHAGDYEVLDGRHKLYRRKP